MVEELKSMVGSDEMILYEGKPEKRCFIFESIFNPLLPFAIVWAVLDMGFLGTAIINMQFVMIPFMLFHLMPVWIYLAGVVFSFRRYRNTYYIVTDHAVYISSGIFTMNLEAKTFAELSRVNLHRGIFDQIFNVGDIQVTTNQFTRKNIPAVLGSIVFQIIWKYIRLSKSCRRTSIRILCIQMICGRKKIMDIEQNIEDRLELEKMKSRNRVQNRICECRESGIMYKIIVLFSVIV